MQSVASTGTVKSHIDLTGDRYTAAHLPSKQLSDGSHRSHGSKRPRASTGALQPLLDEVEPCEAATALADDRATRDLIPLSRARFGSNSSIISVTGLLSHHSVIFVSLF